MNAQAFVSILAERGLKISKEAQGWKACCPGHADKNPSLSVNEAADGRVLVYCHAGCDLNTVLSALNLSSKDLATDLRKGTPPSRRIVATYDYNDESGTLLYQVVRLEPKDFRQRRRDASQPDGWNWSTKGIRRVPYKLSIVKAAVLNRVRVWICEGEKDVDALSAQAEIATCNSGGAGQFGSEHAEHFQGAEVVIVSDKDERGRKHARGVAAILRSVALSVRIIEVPDVNGQPCKDTADFLSAGGTTEQLNAMADTAPEWALGSDAAVTNSANPCADVRGELLAILQSKEAPDVKGKQIAAAVLLHLMARGHFYFNEALRDFDSAMYFDRERGRLERVRSDAFLAWLSKWTAINRAAPSFKFIARAVETEALSGDSTSGIIPESYWASRPGLVYMSNGDASMVRISGESVEIVDNGTDGVLFAAGRTLEPWSLTTPVDPFESCDVFKNIQTAADHGKDLFRVWLYSLPTNPKSKPPFCPTGEIGSGKTRSLKAVAEFYGLPFLASNVEESSEGDFWPNMNSGGLYILDNADTCCRWLPDAVANASTDGCVQKRRLYTNTETVTLRANAWLAITTANPSFASDAGLADRLLIVRMKRREGETKDSELTSQVRAARDGGLSHVAQTLSRALGDRAAVPSGLNERHPDFAEFAVRIGRALGREASTIAALQSAETDKAAFCIENDPVGAAIMVIVIRDGHLEGKAAEIGPLLASVDPDLAWAAAPRRLSKRLIAIWPHISRVLRASKEPGHGGIVRFSFRPK